MACPVGEQAAADPGPPAGDAIQLGGNLHKVYGTWLQGADPLRARLLDGTTFRLSAPLTNRGGLEPTGNWQTITQD